MSSVFLVFHYEDLVEVCATRIIAEQVVVDFLMRNERYREYQFSIAEKNPRTKGFDYLNSIVIECNNCIPQEYETHPIFSQVIRCSNCKGWIGLSKENKS